ncbi:hypothetical protein Tco_0693759, partial [Tanacetum coccineum]
IPGKSIDEGLAPLMSDEDVLSLLKYVSRYREIEDDDVENITKASTSKVTPLGKGSNESTYGLSDSDSTNHPPWSSENLSKVPIEKAEHGIEEPMV